MNGMLLALVIIIGSLCFGLFVFLLVRFIIKKNADRNRPAGADPTIRKFNLRSSFSGTKVIFNNSGSYDNVIDVSFKHFSGTYNRSLKLFSEEIVEFKFDFNLVTGSLSVELISPDGRIIDVVRNDFCGVKEYKIDVSGTYKVKVRGDGASGKYGIEFYVKNENLNLS